MYETQTLNADHAPGLNKQLRDRTKYALAVTVLLLVAGKLHWACLPSAYSIYNLKAGTAVSSKNAKWMFLSVTSFIVSLTCFIMEGGARLVDGDRDYSFQARLRFYSFAARSFWWPVLTLFLMCTWYPTLETVRIRQTSGQLAVTKKIC